MRPRSHISVPESITCERPHAFSERVSVFSGYDPAKSQLKQHSLPFARPRWRPHEGCVAHKRQLLGRVSPIGTTLKHAARVMCGGCLPCRFRSILEHIWCEVCFKKACLFGFCQSIWRGGLLQLGVGSGSGMQHLPSVALKPLVVDAMAFKAMPGQEHEFWVRQRFARTNPKLREAAACNA